MTFVGKILVIVIMAFALLFLGISTVVFSTAKNWMVATKAEQAKVDDLNKKLNDAKAGVEAAKKGLEDAKGQFDQEKKNLDNRLATLNDENTRNLAQITAVRGQLGVAEQTAKSTLEEVTAKREQTVQLRTQISAVEKQANEFKLHQAELNDQIRELERHARDGHQEQLRPSRSASPSSRLCSRKTASRPTSARSRVWKARPPVTG